MVMNRALIFFAALSLAPLASACTWETDLPDDAKSIAVDPSKELVVTDETPVLASLSSNASDGPLSFRHATSSLGLDNAAVLAWLDAWSQRLRDEGHADRADAFDANVTRAWLARAPENQCDVTRAHCATRKLPLASAPFRLIAVANRTDLSVMPDRAADGGEGRLVFALTDGAADDASAPTLPMTVIFEYAQQGTALDWTKSWHALGASSDANFPASLSALAGRFVDAGSLAQVRTADALTGPLVMHQFEIDGGDLVAKNVRNTPDWSRVREADVDDYASANASAIADGTAVMPKTWWASAATIGGEPDWVTAIPSHDDLVGETCGGCHAKTDDGFQIDPLATGKNRLSKFLSDPTKPQDEIGRRVEWMQLALSQGT
jgi:hypothetical protein